MNKEKLLKVLSNLQYATISLGGFLATIMALIYLSIDDVPTFFLAMIVGLLAFIWAELINIREGQGK